MLSVDGRYSKIFKCRNVQTAFQSDFPIVMQNQIRENGLKRFKAIEAINLLDS